MSWLPLKSNSVLQCTCKTCTFFIKHTLSPFLFINAQVGGSSIWKEKNIARVYVTQLGMSAVFLPSDILSCCLSRSFFTSCPSSFAIHQPTLTVQLNSCFVVLSQYYHLGFSDFFRGKTSSFSSNMLATSVMIRSTWLSSKSQYGT